ncbi:hypothetical protein LGH83_04650 [Lichenihabitans sp. PAMC28606]|uniref:DUF4376 domain-containing protein n=1 Tax=Lichenihabitans sp. PAMC28606 TaxID=2880932 RepID=UPI001D0B00C8|nr:hypothetical protein [Lichenihabitans sp. PAMC28606]UDL95517.1 hypothetical protein LGH83_04650 [Lichenihabitans sp. PAMC28606]
MTDTAVAPYGWAAVGASGLACLFVGAQPQADTYTSIKPLETASDFVAAMDALRFPPATLAQTQSSQVAALRAACSAAIVSGFTSAALGSPHTYPSDMTSQINLSGSVLASILPGLTSSWTTEFWAADSTGAWAFAPHTAAQIQQVGTDGKAAVMAAQAKLATLTGQVTAATTIPAVQMVVWW